jgi:hypothetical protein
VSGRPALGIPTLLLLVLVACSQSPAPPTSEADPEPEFDPTGRYEGKMTADDGTESEIVLVTIGERSGNGPWPFTFQVKGGSVEPIQGDCGRVEDTSSVFCAVSDASGIITFEGPVNDSGWSGEWFAALDSGTTLEGTFVFNRIREVNLSPAGTYEGPLRAADGTASEAVIATIGGNGGSSPWPFTLKRKGSTSGALYGECGSVEGTDRLRCAATDDTGTISLEGALSVERDWSGDWSAVPTLVVTVPGGGEIIIDDPVTYWPDHWPFATSNGPIEGTFVFNRQP